MWVLFVVRLCMPLVNQIKHTAMNSWMRAVYIELEIKWRQSDLTLRYNTGTYLMKLRKTPTYYNNTSLSVKSNQDDNDWKNPTEEWNLSTLALRIKFKWENKAKEIERGVRGGGNKTDTVPVHRIERL